MEQVIVLTVAPGDPGELQVNYLLWLPVTVGQEIPLTPGAVSQYKGATAAENAALIAGQVLEEMHTARYPTTLGAAAIKADLVARYSTRLGIHIARANPMAFYGVFYDGAAWSA